MVLEPGIIYLSLLRNVPDFGSTLLQFSSRYPANFCDQIGTVKCVPKCLDLYRYQYVQRICIYFRCKTHVLKY